MKDSKTIKNIENIVSEIVPGYNITKNIITLPDSIESDFFEKK